MAYLTNIGDCETNKIKKTLDKRRFLCYHTIYKSFGRREMSTSLNRTTYIFSIIIIIAIGNNNISRRAE